MSMAERAGVPCWVSLVTRDVAATEHFYGAVLGWQFRDSSFGAGFRVATLDGLPVAGISEQKATWNAPVSWTVYFEVDDADATVSRIAERGGTIGVGPVRLGEGRAVLAAGPGGAGFGLWQGERPGHWAVGEYNAPGWLELRTHDAFAAAMFYGQVFGWSDDNERCEINYAHEDNEVFIRYDGHPIAGLRGEDVENLPERGGLKGGTHWRVYFEVSDVTRVVESALAAGGEVVDGPEHRSMGETAELRDAEGAMFSVLAHRSASRPEG
jgi:uncharacterized protein